MLLHGTTSNPVITGSSVHNQRIERLWRDTYRCVLSLFYQLFYYLEDRQKLDPTSDLDLYCLHLVYVSKINFALRSFSEGWNNHAVTTERCMTPSQMFTSGTLLSGHSLDLGSNLQERVTFNLGPPSVVIPLTESPLNSRQEDRVKQLLDDISGTDEDDYRIGSYEAVRTYVHQQLGS